MHNKILDGLYAYFCTVHSASKCYSVRESFRNSYIIFQMISNIHELCFLIIKYGIKLFQVGRDFILLNTKVYNKYYL